MKKCDEMATGVCVTRANRPALWAVVPGKKTTHFR